MYLIFLNDPLSDPLNDPLNARQKEIISIIKNNSKITKEELTQKTSVSVETIKRDFRVLVKNDLIKHFGSKKAAYWKLSK